jgi:hypothetical protein
MDGWTDMTKLIVAVRNFANGSKHGFHCVNSQISIFGFGFPETDVTNHKMTAEIRKSFELFLH